MARRVGKDKKDFIIPLRIDDLPHDVTKIEVSRLNVIDFYGGWAGGFAQLLRKLDEDGVSKNTSQFNPGAVAEWWRENERQIAEVSASPEMCASNWFLIGDLPETFYLHSLVDPLKEEGPRMLDIGIPNYRERGGLLSIENGSGMARRLKEKNLELLESAQIQWSDFWFNGHKGLKLGKSETRNILTSLLQQAFALLCHSAGLKAYALSGQKTCFWFPPGLLEGDKAHFAPLSENPARQKSYRQLVGRRLKNNGEPTKRRWHFALQAKLQRWPKMLFAVQTHVIFTDAEGELLSMEKQHVARRSVCRSWHNDRWLNLMLAAMAHLSDPAYSGYISVPCGDDVGFTVSTRPLTFSSPIRYGPSFDKEPDDLSDEETADDEEDDDDEGEESTEEETDV